MPFLKKNSTKNGVYLAQFDQLLMSSLCFILKYVKCDSIHEL